MMLFTTAHDYVRELQCAIEATRKAGAFIRKHAGSVSEKAVRDKGTHDLVTFVDEEAERIIQTHLEKHFADYEMLGEEGADGDIRAAVEGKRWIVDPLDGTTNFNHSVPPYAVSIALQDRGELVLGVVYDVAHDEMFSAIKGVGATLNGKPIGVSETTALGESLIATGFPFRDYRYVEGYLETFERVMRGTRGIRRHGAAAVDLAWVACGRFDGFFEAGLAPWDLAAGIVLIEAAGGVVSGLPEGTNPTFDGGIVAANPAIHGILVDMAYPLGKHYGKNVLGMDT
ncbi:MAG: inositol monophosphatase family protein [Rubricoccaceae bacterium]|nr:inositol monophosphatase family protein [Rubricoccaceae bacterium]